LFKGAGIGALGGIDTALQASEDVHLADEGKAQGTIFLDIPGFADRIGFVEPELGFDGAEAAELPLGVYQGIDEEAGKRCGGLELVMVLSGEGFELGRIFAGNDHGLGVNTGFHGIAA